MVKELLDEWPKVDENEGFIHGSGLGIEHDWGLIDEGGSLANGFTGIK